MRADEVKTILKYKGEIPRMLRLVDRELARLDDEYSSLHGIEMDGMPRATMPGKPTENLAEKLAGDSLRAYRIAALRAKKKLLVDDAAVIQGEIDRMGSVAQKILNERFVIGRSWEDTAAATEWSISTTKRKGIAALCLLGRGLDLLENKNELLARAQRARI